MRREKLGHLGLSFLAPGSGLPPCTRGQLCRFRTLYHYLPASHQPSLGLSFFIWEMESWHLTPEFSHISNNVT